MVTNLYFINYLTIQSEFLRHFVVESSCVRRFLYLEYTRIFVVLVVVGKRNRKKEGAGEVENSGK